LPRDGSELVLVGDGDPRAGRLIVVTDSAFRTQSAWIAPAGFDALRRPLRIVDSFDRVSGRMARVVRPDTGLNGPGSLNRLCGSWDGGTFIVAP
jgi:hypothetical protein